MYIFPARFGIKTVPFSILLKFCRHICTWDFAASFSLLLLLLYPVSIDWIQTIYNINIAPRHSEMIPLWQFPKLCFIIPLMNACEQSKNRCVTLHYNDPSQRHCAESILSVKYQTLHAEITWTHSTYSENIACHVMHKYSSRSMHA